MGVSSLQWNFSGKRGSQHHVDRGVFWSLLLTSSEHCKVFLWVAKILPGRLPHQCTIGFPKKLSQVALFQHYETKEEVLIFFRKERLLLHYVRQQAKCTDHECYQLSLAGWRAHKLWKVLSIVTQHVSMTFHFQSWQHVPKVIENKQVPWSLFPTLTQRCLV